MGVKLQDLKDMNRAELLQAARQLSKLKDKDLERGVLDFLIETYGRDWRGEVSRNPEFRHIHCSSRFDRSPESLEADLDVWMEDSSLITLTEVAGEDRGAKLREKGWGHYRANKSRGADNCAILWRKDDWKCNWQAVRKLHTTQIVLVERQTLAINYVHAASVLLQRKDSGHKVLVSVAHMPYGVDGAQPGFSNRERGWESRKKAYQESVHTWSTWVKDIERQRKPDAVMVIADWNVNLKDTWFREYLKEHWGDKYKHAWQQFPTEGASLHGGPVAPLGAPGVSPHDRIIDGTLYTGLKVDHHPNLMATVRSSDHRPYHEGFRLMKDDDRPDDDQPGGDVHPGEEWWGFGDYLTDELYVLPSATGEAGGEVV